MSSQWYTAAPFYLLRVPVLPATLFPTLSQQGQLDRSQEQNLDQAYRHARKASLHMLAQLATHPLIEQALMVASPSLAAALGKPGKQKEMEDRRSERAYERLLRYVIRMSRRPTPFGCCAGVASGTFAAQSRVQVERFEPVGVRPDRHWLWTWLSEIEARFLPVLEVQVTPALFVFGNRGIGVRQGKQGKDGRQDERLWLHMTPVFHRLREVARLPVPYPTLKRALLTDFPQATAEQVDAFLHELFHMGVLLTSLLPADEHDPLSHVIDVLRPLPEASTVIAQLEVIQAAIQAAMHSASQSIHILPTVIQRVQALTPQFEGIPVQVDTRVRMKQNELSSAIGQEAAKVAEVLLRLGLYPQGLPSLHRARRLFLERYEEQEVPLLALFAPQGALEHLYDQGREPGELSRELPPEQQRRLTRRTRLLHSLAMQAVNERIHTIELTPELVERFSLWSPSEGLPPPLLDLYMQIDAASLEAIDRGDWRGLVTLLPLGGRSYRRFLSLFGEHEQEMVREVLRAGEERCPGSLCASLAVLPTHVRDMNVMHGPLWSAYVLPINRPSPVAPEQTLLPDDLLVSLRAGRFLLRSQRYNKAVRVIQPHMLSLTHLPPIARFLLEASHDGEPFPGPFQWGQAGTLPFLPRLTWGKIIVSLARWTLSQELLACREAETGGLQWFRALQRWREQWRVPRYVSLLEDENSLLLDLEHPLMADILRQELVRTKKALHIQEAFFHENESWLRDTAGNRYVSEVVIPLIRTTTAPQPPPLRGTPRVIAEQERRFLPGQAWLSLKLYLPEALHPLLLTGSWSAFVRRSRSLFEGWFFVRYHDSQDHLRLRILARHEQQRHLLLEAILAWCQQIQQEGFLTHCVLDTYERETERYGGPEAIATIEQVFCANSEAICALLAELLAEPQGTHPLLFEAVYALDRLWADWGYDLSARHRALQRSLPPAKESHTMLLSEKQHGMKGGPDEYNSREHCSRTIPLFSPLIRINHSVRVMLALR
ncbi:MAG: lantibiotic dehydratase [Ktedonobacteraceae bacterium]|nr:lantibiotic dehydratase [Ktedonobacteraceae bacterium]